jgi:UDP-N-acetylmuramate dehydrogenase
VVQLKRYNTLQLPAKVGQLIRLTASSDLVQLRKRLRQAKQVLIIGGGSNLVVCDRPAATVLCVDNRGIQLIEQRGAEVIVQAAAGEPWHDFVMHCLDHGWNGLENLALIPGKVGASPIQNIGAYGLEVGERIDSVQVWHWPTGRVQIWSARDCQFGYRDSIFKRYAGCDWVVLAVRFRLSIKPDLRLSYADLKQRFAAPSQATPRSVAQAVIAIRQQKLPDPSVLPNVGSFFKNPILSEQAFAKLQAQFPDLPKYIAAGAVKTSAAWLIDRCGWKGRRRGAVGVHAAHALVLVNYGGGTGSQIMHLARAIAADVKQRFDIDLEPEPIVW